MSASPTTDQHRDEEPATPTLDDLFIQVQALERHRLSMDVAFSTLCQALACAFAVGKAADLRRIALDLLSTPLDTHCTDPVAVDHGLQLAGQTLIDMAAAIERGEAAAASMIAGSDSVQ